MTSPSDHIMLLELLGWTIPEGLTNWRGRPDGTMVFFHPMEDEPPEPPLDDLLLRTAREQLLTTEELRTFFAKLLCERLLPIQFPDGLLDLYTVLSASAADQAAVLVRMLRKEKA